MKLQQIFIAILLVCSPALADEKKPELADYILPIPVNMAAAASAAMKASGRDLSQYFKVMGIRFPEGAKINLDKSKSIITARLTHQEALRVIQIIKAFIDDPSGKLTKEIFGTGESVKSPPEDD